MSLQNNVTLAPNWCLHHHDSVTLLPTDKSELSVGRGTDRGLSIQSQAISAIHAVFFASNESLMLQDLGSRNGTFVNGVQIQANQMTVVEPGDLIQFADEMFRIGISDRSSCSATLDFDSADSALAAIEFEKLINESAVLPFFQPIVQMDDRAAYGYEVLARSQLEGLTNPALMFDIASKLNMESELSRECRRAGMTTSQELPPEAAIFLNTHPAEMENPQAFRESLTELRDQFADSKIVLEIHEETATSCLDLRSLRDLLRDLQIGLAYDDFGRGQTRFKELIEVPPDVLKFDMSLIQKIDTASDRSKALVQQLVKMATDFGILALAEGVEREEEHQVCFDMGFNLGQGYYYGRPQPVNHYL